MVPLAVENAFNQGAHNEVCESVLVGHGGGHKMSLYRTSALYLALEDALDEACPNFTEAERSRALDQYDKVRGWKNV